MREDAPQREYALHGLFNALRYLPHDSPTWATVCQQWTRSEYAAAVHDIDLQVVKRPDRIRGVAPPLGGSAQLCLV